MYGIKENYTTQLEPQYFQDVLDDSAQWQAGVYRLAAQLARHYGAKRIIDLGCGRAQKLLQYADEFQVVGVDYGDNIQHLINARPDQHWVIADLNTDIIDSENFENSVVICADVIEHIPDPSALMKTLRNAAKVAKYVIVSTPDRLKVYKGEHDGPPGNPAHVREWTNAELQAYFKTAGFTIQWAGWTISNDARPDQVWTSLLVLSNTHTIDSMMPEYRPAKDFAGMHRPRANERIKVWMTPTPTEAARDPHNAIHQVVLRMAKHLPEFGVDLVEQPDNADLRAGHAGQGSNAPIDVAHYHGLYNTAGGHTAPHFFAINSHVIANLRSAKIITAPSEWIADVIRRDMHINPEIIGWGVDLDEWTPDPNPGLYVLWNKARVDAVSDPAPMLELAARVPNMPFLTTFGEGGENVRTIGRQTYEDMKNYVRKAAVYLATVTETFGIATLEAMASGVPVLGFRHGNTACLVEHGVTGFLAEPGDIDGLVAGLEYCLKYRDILGTNAREAAKQYTWENTAKRFAAVYRQVLEPHQGTKVSVVIPCHNYEEYVGEAVESALAQEADFDYEIIVILDRCTDRSAQVVAGYADRGVKALTVDNGSLSKTRNDGIRSAQGEYIVLLDADDKLGNVQFLETLANALDNDRTLGIAFTSIRLMDAQGHLGNLNPWPKGFDFVKQATRQNQIPSCCMFRKKAWQRAGGFHPWFKYAEDAEFWLGVLGVGYNAKHVVEDGWFHYRVHSKSASQVHRTGEVKEPDWTEFYPWTRDAQPPFAAFGTPTRGSWPVRFYLKPDASVIVPVGPGHEESLKDTLHSIEGQSHRYWECIVVNDTGKPLDLMGFPWAKVIESPAGGIGAGAARNLGAQYANAPFLVFVDADDILKPRFLERALATYKATGRYAYIDWMTDDGRGNQHIYQTPEYTLDEFRAHPSLHPVTALVPRAWFNTVDGFDESMPAFEDVDFYLKLLTKGFCGQRIPEPLLVYNLETGLRRKAGERLKPELLALLESRYKPFMEAKAMCDCVQPPKGKAPVPPTPENVAEYRETYGEMVKVQYVSPFAPVSPTTLRGPATRVYYGERAKGDIFFIWQADMDNSEGTFVKVDEYETEPIPTTIPPSPPYPFAWVENPQGAFLQYSEPAPAPEAIVAAEPESVSVFALLMDMTKAQLKAYAEEHDIDLTGHTKNRDTMLEAILGAELKPDAEAVSQEL